MARLSQASISSNPATRSPDPMTDLNRLLSRLHQTVLRADADRERRLRTSEYERSKVNVNIDYARTLLTRMEQEALTIKVHSRRQEMQTDLIRKRELLEQLTDRMKDLEEIGASAEDDDDASSDGEDILGDIIATPSESMDSSRSTDVPTEDTGEEDSEPSHPTAATEQPIPQEIETQAAAALEEAPAQEIISEKPEAHTSQTLRARGRQPEPDPEKQDGADATGLSTGTARSLLFGNRPGGAAPLPVSAATTTEAILDHQRAEQDVLSESILKMASDLKLSSLAFGEALEEDTEVLARTGEGLDKSGRGLEAAAGKMSALVRATEGKGWWGRILLYAWIYGMMVFLVLLVFVLPKLRF